MLIDLDRMRSAGRTLIQRAPILPRGVLVGVGVGVAFGIGLVVGGSGGAHAVAASQPADVLTIAQGKSNALDETRARLKLTYASELLTRDAAEPRRAPPARALQPTVAVTQEEEAAAPLESPPAPVEAPPAPPAAAADESDGERGEDVQKRSGADLKAALARVVDDLKPAARFSLQVAAAPTQAGAQAVVDKLGSQGHSARVIEGQVGGKPVFRVRVGAFNDRAQADAYKARLALPAFIVNE